jgi:hypothetical protein
MNQPLTFKNHSTISLLEFSDIVNISYKTLYERYKVGTLLGCPSGGLIHIHITPELKWLDHLLNFKANNPQIEIVIFLDEKDPAPYNNSFGVPYDKFYNFLEDLSNMTCFRGQNNKILTNSNVLIHINPDETSKIVRMCLIHINDCDERQITAMNVDMNKPELLKRQKEIDTEFLDIIKQKYQYPHYVAISNGYGGLFHPNTMGYMKAEQAYFLYKE